jgi:predicted nuclease of predicted toxin-antitoxin system
MRFLVDECTGPAVAKWLRGLRYDVLSIFDEARGLDDVEIIDLANKDDYILITCDKDFGELIFRERKPHKGVILLRLEDERRENKIIVLERFLNSYSDQISNNFIVVTENSVRIARNSEKDSSAGPE